MLRVKHHRLLLNWLYSILPVILIALLLQGCGLQKTVFPPEDVGYPEPPPPETTIIEPRRSGPANALYVQAKESLARGDNQRAELAMERALRIEPANAYYWYTMGRVKYRQGKYNEAIQFCLKSKSLAGRNTRLLSANDKLINEAKKDTGTL